MHSTKLTCICEKGEREREREIRSYIAVRQACAVFNKKTRKWERVRGREKGEGGEECCKAKKAKSRTSRKCF
jgi:hypothetical protein